MLSWLSTMRARSKILVGSYKTSTLKVDLVIGNSLWRQTKYIEWIGHIGFRWIFGDWFSHELLQAMEANSEFVWSYYVPVAWRFGWWPTESMSNLWPAKPGGKTNFCEAKPQISAQVDKTSETVTLHYSNWLDWLGLARLEDSCPIWPERWNQTKPIPTQLKQSKENQTCLDGCQTWQVGVCWACRGKKRK